MDEQILFSEINPILQLLIVLNLGVLSAMTVQWVWWEITSWF